MKSDSLTEQSDIKQAQRGDKNAFSRLYERYAGRVYATSLRLCGQQNRAEDALQETFLKVWQQLPQFAGRSQFSTWLQRIAMNTAIDHWRREPVLADIAQVEQDSYQPGADDERDLEQAIRRLPKQARAVFVLVAVEGFTHAEAGRLLEIEAGTSKAQYFRAKQLLRDYLGGHSNE